MPQKEQPDGTQAPVMDIGQGNWENRTGHGSIYKCAADQFACGVCQSGKDQSCQGSTWRLKCCDVETPDNTAGWVAVAEIVAPTTIALSVGSSYSDQQSVTHTHTVSWSASLTIGGVNVPNKEAGKKEEEGQQEMAELAENAAGEEGEAIAAEEGAEGAAELAEPIMLSISDFIQIGEVAAAARRRLATAMPGDNSGGAVSGNAGQSWSTSQTSSQTVENSFSYGLKYQYGDADVGKTLWQWQWSLTAGKKLSSSTNVLALTDSISDPPKCFPNHN